MPIDPVTGALIGTGVQAAVSGGNALMQGNQNRKNRKFAKEMFYKGIAENRKSWQMQNEYNTPAAQRARLEAAGLNPALMYGQNASGGNAGAVSSQSAPSFDQRAPMLDGGLVQGFFDTRVKQAQTSNQEKQGRLIEKEILQKDATTLKTLEEARRLGVNIKSDEFQLMKDKMLLDYQLDGAELQNRLTEANYKNIETRENIAKVMMHVDINRSIAEVARIYTGINLTNQQIKNFRVQEKIGWEELEWMKDGLTKGDPVWMRVLAKQISQWSEKMGMKPSKPNTQSGLTNTIGSWLLEKYLKFKK